MVVKVLFQTLAGCSVDEVTVQGSSHLSAFTHFAWGDARQQKLAEKCNSEITGVESAQVSDRFNKQALRLH